MKKVYKESQLLEVNNIPLELIESMKVTIDILNENYGVNWTSSLFLLSSDFAIVVVTTEELSKFLLE
ncbi:MAG: hypothetical protein KH415_17380 [Clostridium sp.]|nr:hypothetical protein [Clostridium sp.]